MRTQYTVGVLILAASTAAAKPPPAAPWKLPDADGKRWAARVEKAAGRDGWAVAVDGNDIVVSRRLPVTVSRVTINAAPNAGPTPDGERAVKYVLRFAPRLSMDEYERLAAANAESAKEYERLHRAVNLPHKFGDFIATTAEEKERVRAFRAAVAKLPHHRLPDLYSPDHSVHFSSPWDGAFPSNKEVAAECQGVEDALRRCFGAYRP